MRPPLRPLEWALLACVIAAAGVAACKGGGSSAGDGPSQSVVAYVANDDSGTLARVVIDAATGAVRAEGHTLPLFVTAQRPVGLDDLALHPGLDAVWVLRGDGSGTSWLARVGIDSATGAISADMPRFALPQIYVRLAVAPNGQLLVLGGGVDLRSYRIDAATRELTEADFVPNPGGVIEMAVHPNGRFVVVVDGAGIGVYSLSKSGALERVDQDGITPGSQDFALTGARRVEIDPRGERVVVVTRTGAVPPELVSLEFDTSKGLLALLGSASSEEDANYPVLASALSTDGTTAYVSHATRAISAFAIDSDTGVPVRIDATAASGGVDNFVLDDGSAWTLHATPGGGHLVATHDLFPPATSVLEIDPATGVLGAIERFGALYELPLRASFVDSQRLPRRTPSTLLVRTADGVTSYAIDAASGGVDEVETEAIASVDTALCEDPFDRWLWVFGSGGVVPIEVDPFTSELEVGTALTGAAHRWFKCAVHPAGWDLVAVNFDYEVVEHQIGLSATGERNGNVGDSPVAELDLPAVTVHQIAVDPAGRSLFVADASALEIRRSAFDPYTRAFNDVATSTRDLPAATVADQIEVDAGGRFVIALLETPIGVPVNQRTYSLAAYPIESPGAGLGAPAVLAATGGGAASFSLDPGGRFIYVPHRLTTDIEIFELDATTGSLSQVDADPSTPAVIDRYALPGIACGEHLTTGQRCLAIDPSGRFLYAPLGGAGVGIHTIDLETGLLSPAGSFDAPANVHALAVFGRFE